MVVHRSSNEEMESVISMYTHTLCITVADKWIKDLRSNFQDIDKEMAQRSMEIEA